MCDKCCLDFQTTVDTFLIRHRSVLDVMTKFQEATARVNRAFAKSVTECGCMAVNAVRQDVPPETEYHQLGKFMSSHLSGQPCQACKEVLSRELGHSLFYLAAVCNLTDLDLHTIVEEETNKIKALGIYHLT